MDFHYSLVNIRREKKLSQEEVAERMGISLETVEEFERYDAYSMYPSRTLLKYAFAVGAKIEFSITEVNKEEDRSSSRNK